MLQGKRNRKAIALSFLLIFLLNMLAPLSAYALTSGPTAPEATSFEPIDTTDMVNLQTGDFTYNIPLLEVPGPEGGYPLSLSYHAGIQPNEEASWVGLGWTLNPGAINRNVNGYPDDWYSPTGSSRTYWNGGQTTTYNVGVSVGIANTPATVSFGLSFSQDTYRGFGVGMNMGFGSKLAERSPFGFSVGMGVDAYGNSYASAGLSAGAHLGGTNLSTSAGIGVSTNFESVNVGASGGIGYRVPSGKNSMQSSLLGASISTGGGKPSLEVGGLSNAVSSTMAAAIQTKSKSYGVDIPTPWGFNISLGYRKVRYWTDETTTTTLHGAYILLVLVRIHPIKMCWIM